MTRATISSKGQLAIPKPIRDQLGLRAGTQVSLDVQGEQIVLRRLVPEFPDWRTMRGMLRTGISMTAALEQEHRDELERDDDRLRRI
jgi:AbrB family looped-hinge helix DNA binding protein